MSDPDWRQRRVFDRELVRTETLVVETRESGGRAIAGLSRNLSPSGIFVETKDRVEVGTEVQLFVGSVRSSSALRVFAQVVHSIPGTGFGARFLDDTPEARDSVTTFISRFRKTG